MHPATKMQKGKQQANEQTHGGQTADAQKADRSNLQFGIAQRAVYEKVPGGVERWSLVRAVACLSAVACFSCCPLDLCHIVVIIAIVNLLPHPF